MNVNKVDNQTSFSGLILKKSILNASNRGVEALEKAIPQIQEIAKVVDVKIKRPLFRAYNCDIHTDFLIKVTQLQPKPKNALDKFINIITKPFLVSEENFAGSHFGFFSDPLEVTKNAKDQVLKQTKS